MKGILRSAVVGWAIICVLTLWPAFLPEPVCWAAAEVDKPVAEDGVRGENPWEAQLIEAALVKQGYFREDVPLSFELQDVLHTACEANNVPYHLALGLIWVESRFQPDADSGISYGLFQLNRNYFPDGLTPAKNIEAGMEYLGSLIDRYGDLGAALTVYNSGSDTGDREYAGKVMAAAERWRTD